MMRILCSICLFLWAAAVQAQETAWVQIEAQPNLLRAEERVRDYAGYLPDVNGFSMPSGWYAIALGPYDRPRAEAVLRRYRAEGQIPRDSFIALSGDYRRQFWPVGAGALNAPALPAPATAPETGDTRPAASAPGSPDAPATIAAPPLPRQPQETPQEARAAEAELSAAGREQLQVALQWAGTYSGAIDGAFGRGTRAAMADWQRAAGFEPTGILTTAQRAELLAAYNAILDGLDLQVVRDPRAGIAMPVPLGVVEFDRYEPPFAHFRARGDLDARVLMISQRGDRDTLHGLYDIMQTLEIVPLSGARSRDSDSFVLTGANDSIVSHTTARLENGEIKGFTLIWPAGDEERRTRLLGEIEAGFARIPGVLDDAAGAGSRQDIDLLAGLEIRKPRLSRSGFYVDAAGTVATLAETVQGCGRITLDGDHDARLLAADADTGLALLAPQTRLAPPGIARLAAHAPRLQSEIAVAGYSYGGVLPAPTLTFGTLADVTGLQGEGWMRRLALSALDGDAGGPVLDTAGEVIGILLPQPRTGRKLPDGVSFAAGADALQALIRKAGIQPPDGAQRVAMGHVDLTEHASAMTVLVGCWD